MKDIDCNVIPLVTGSPDHDCHGTGVGSIGLGLFPSLWHWHWHWQSDSESGSQAADSGTGSLLSRLPGSLVTVIATVNHVTDAMTVTRDRDRLQPCYGDLCRAAVVGLSRQDSHWQLGA
jgi:hypothetical protein